MTAVTTPIAPTTDEGNSMTTTTFQPTSPSARASTVTTTTSHRQTLARAIRAEWVKIRTLRSTWIGMASVILVLVGLGAVSAALSTGSVTEPGDGGGFGGSDPLSTVLAGADIAVLLVGVLGALAGAREYGSRMIAATVAAVPRRWQVVVSKATVLSGVVFTTALIGVFAAFGVGMSILAAGDSATAALTDDGVLSSVLGMAGYITAIAVLGLGLGILLRSVASSIGILVGGIMILPPLAGALLPSSFDPILQYLPSSAASSFTTVMGSGNDVLTAGTGALVLLAWVVAALASATVAITRRDV